MNTETVACLECSGPMQRQSELSKFSIHRLCYVRFTVKFWLVEASETWAAMWNRADRWLNRHKSVFFGFVGSWLIWALVRSAF